MTHQTQPDYTGMRVTVLGLGTFGGGAAAARFLQERGAVVTVTDLRSEEQLGSSVAGLSDLPGLRWFLSGHPVEAFKNAEIVVLNPAVKPDASVRNLIPAAAVITTETELFLRHNRGRVIAVTGSNGKSTTAALIHSFLQSETSTHTDSRTSPDAGTRRVWLGGNIGQSLLPVVTQIQPQDDVVLEISSFQLHLLKSFHFRPAIAVLTNFSPNHLDWHGSVDHYRDSKQILFATQGMNDVAIVPDEDTDAVSGSGAASAAELTPVRDEWRIRGRRMLFGLSDTGEAGAFLEEGTLILRDHHREDAVRLTCPPALPGDHNRRNVAAAACAAWMAGADPSGFRSALGRFTPLPHRLTQVAEGRGVRFFDDSKATTPESSIAALETFPTGKVVLLAGGADKGSDLTAFADAILQRTAVVVLMGETAPRLASMLSSHGCCIVARNFPHAFEAAVASAPPGAIVLLSPG
ncbi:MAG: UDP-N-acetylmuramoyl-L-alanine--D-glutamate ligase, partial [Planctomycetaceae bacterium]|nr:UDP-N-acetylmuramoyl-L-alanine--D-glutamate ligase [Planctomycetaceae bacterium]